MYPGLTELLDATLNKYTAIAMTVIDLVFTTDQRQLQVQPQKTSFRWRWLCVLKLEHTQDLPLMSLADLALGSNSLSILFDAVQVRVNPKYFQKLEYIEH